MVRDILGGIDTGILAQVGLLAFFVAFLCILIYAFTLSRAARDHAKSLPLADSTKTIDQA